MSTRILNGYRVLCLGLMLCLPAIGCNDEDTSQIPAARTTLPKRNPVAAGSVQNGRSGRRMAAVQLDSEPDERARMPQLPGREDNRMKSPMTKTSWSMLGGSGFRNAVNSTTGVSLSFKLGENDQPDENVLWKSRLGSLTYGSPVIDDDVVLVGTNNGAMHRPAYTDDRGVLLCFEANTGALRWQLTREKLPGGPANDWPEQGICSTPVLHNNRAYVVTNRCELMCLDLEGFHDQENDGPFTTEADHELADADIIWSLDLIAECGVYPHNLATSSPVIAEDLVLINTSNGVGEDDQTTPAPQAPSFLAANCNTGSIVWQNNLPSADSRAPAPHNRLLNGQWSSPTIAVVGGELQAFFTGGDGVLYGLNVRTGELIWWFDLNPPESEYLPGGRGERCEIVATPVFVDDSIIIATGRDPEAGDGVGYVYRIDATRTGNISPFVQDSDGSWRPSARSGQMWRFGGLDPDGSLTGEQGGFVFRRTISSAVVNEGLVFIPSLAGFLHCLDFQTGQQYWQHDCFASIWSSPTIVDGRVLLGTEDGVLLEVAASSEFRKLNEFHFPAPIYGTPAIANGVLFVADRSTLFAIPVTATPSNNE